jgi:prevent-host-death family protein
MPSESVRQRWLAASKRGEGTLFPEDRESIDRSLTIFRLVSHNPKRRGSAERFALYRDGMTVQDYIDAVARRGDPERVALDDISWDLNRDFIALRSPGRVWSVAEAKAKLSEILRLARDGEPQTIGTEDPCVVVSARQFARDFQSNDLGRFLIESAPRGFELEMPSRAGDRDFSFDDGDRGS